MTERKQHLDALAISLLLVCCLFWGFQQILIKITVAEVPPLWQASLRFLGATVFLYTSPFVVAVLAAPPEDEERAQAAEGGSGQRADARLTAASADSWRSHTPGSGHPGPVRISRTRQA